MISQAKRMHNSSYYLRNRPEILVAAEKYRRANHERINENARKYYRRNRGRIIVTMRKYRKKNAKAVQQQQGRDKRAAHTVDRG